MDYNAGVFTAFVELAYLFNSQSFIEASQMFSILKLALEVHYQGHSVCRTDLHSFPQPLHIGQSPIMRTPNNQSLVDDIFPVSTYGDDTLREWIHC